MLAFACVNGAIAKHLYVYPLGSLVGRVVDAWNVQYVSTATEDFWEPKLSAGEEAEAEGLVIRDAEKHQLRRNK